MAQYKEGTVDIEKGTQFVRGYGTNWLLNVEPGQLFRLVGAKVHYIVGDVVADDLLLLTGNFLQDDVLAGAYIISRDFTQNLSLIELYTGDYEVLALITESFRRIDSYVGTLALIAGGNLPALPDLEHDYVLMSAGGVYTWQLRTALVTAEPTPAERAAAGETRRVYGYGVNGLPDAETQAAIDAFLAAGWPAYAIDWVYLGESSGVRQASAAIPSLSLGLSLGAVTVSAVQVLPAGNTIAAVPAFGMNAALNPPAVTAVSAGSAVATIPSLGLGASFGIPTVTGVQVATAQVAAFSMLGALTAPTVAAVATGQAVAVVGSFGLSAALTAPTVSAAAVQSAVAAVPVFAVGAALNEPAVSALAASELPSATVVMAPLDTIEPTATIIMTAA